MRTGYTGHDGIARPVTKIYVGINNKARRAVRGYAGVDGVARLIYPVDQPLPTVSGVYTYDRGVHEAIISDIDDDMIAVSGVTKTTNAGTYTVTFTLKSPMYRWIDGTNTPKTGTWTINKKVISIPYIMPGTYTYTGAVQSASISEHDPFGVAISGEPTAINAGNHVVKFNLSSANNYIWSDGTSEEKTDSWSIAPIAVVVPTVSGAFTYNTKAQSASVSYASGTSDLIAESGVKTATNAGSYSVFFNLKDAVNYIWNDNTTGQKKGDWAIAKASVTSPTLNTPLVYSGKEQTVSVSGYDKNLMTYNAAETKGTNVNSYSVTFTLLDPNNYLWASTGKSSALVVPWAIVKASVIIPTVSKNPEYSGSSVSPILANYSASTVVLSGDTSKIAVGNYTIIFNLVNPSNYQWSDGSISAKSAPWSIIKKYVTIPSLYNKSKTYNGTEQSVSITAYDKNVVEVSGMTKATNAGTYYVYFNLINASNYQWSDGSVKQKSDTWTINKASVAVPTLSGTYTYNGSAQTVTKNGYDSNSMTVSGDTQTNAGNYTATFNVKSNYKWNDGTTTAKTRDWSINPKQLTYISIDRNTDPQGNAYIYCSIMQDAEPIMKLQVKQPDGTIKDGSKYYDRLRVIITQRGTYTAKAWAYNPNYTGEKTETITY